MGVVSKGNSYALSSFLTSPVALSDWKIEKINMIFGEISTLNLTQLEGLEYNKGSNIDRFSPQSSNNKAPILMKS